MTATQNRPDPPGSNADTTAQPGGVPTQQAARGRRAPGRVPRSRMGGAWVALVVAAIVFLLLLIFILQNGQRAEVSFLGAHGHLPMGVALLLAAVFGVLLVALPGTARIIQLRMVARRRGTGVEPEPRQPARPDHPAGR